MSHRDFILAVHDKLDEMRKYGPKNAWLYLPCGAFYFRLTRHVCAGKAASTIDLANFSIAPAFQSKGYFKMLIWALEQYAINNGIQAVYFESVLNPIVDRYLRSLRYEEAGQHAIDCLYRRV